MHHHTIEVSIDFFYGDKMRHTVEMKGNISQAAAVINHKAFTALIYCCLFNKFGICNCKTWYAFLCLCYNGVVLFFYGTHD
jgi:hypothetical protein